MSDVKVGRGGVRSGAGRKKLSDEQIAAKAKAFQKTLIDELIFPAVCTAFHADPGPWNERILTFELSGTQIRAAYGHAGLKEWKSYFTAVRRGGSDRFGQAYQTLWRFNNAKYGFVLTLVESLGHTLKDLPNPGFPPDAMLVRLAVFSAKQKARAAKWRTNTSAKIIGFKAPGKKVNA